jgi:tetratricopeptide (TPR) repeat protein
VDLPANAFADKPLAIKNNVPFVEQTTALCGPTALYMATKSLKPDLELSQVTALTFSPQAKGTFKQDLLAGARRLGFAPYPVDSLAGMLNEVAKGEPVVIFHQTDFFWKNYWHFSVIAGYDLDRETFLVHIGKEAFHEMSFAKIQKTWEEGGRWACVILPPGNLPTTATFENALENSLAFLRLGQNDHAYALAEEMNRRWPNRYEADVVRAEALHHQKEDQKALLALKTAFQKNPENDVLKKKIREFQE